MKRSTKTTLAVMALGVLAFGLPTVGQTMESRVDAASDAAKIELYKGTKKTATSRVRQVFTMTDARGMVLYHGALLPSGSQPELSCTATFGGVAPENNLDAVRQTTGQLEGCYTPAPVVGNASHLRLSVGSIWVNGRSANLSGGKNVATGTVTNFFVDQEHQVPDRLHPFDANLTLAQYNLGVSIGASVRGDFLYQGKKCQDSDPKYVRDVSGELFLRFTPVCTGLADAGLLELKLTNITSSAGVPKKVTLSRGASTINSAVDSTILFIRNGDLFYTEKDADVQIFDFTGGTQTNVLNVAYINRQTNTKAATAAPGVNQAYLIPNN